MQALHGSASGGNQHASPIINQISHGKGGVLVSHPNVANSYNNTSTQGFHSSGQRVINN